MTLVYGWKMIRVLYYSTYKAGCRCSLLTSHIWSDLRLAALLVGMAGGLADLARVPACNMTVMGQEKRYLGGFGMVAGMPHTGAMLGGGGFTPSTRPLGHHEPGVLSPIELALLPRRVAAVRDSGPAGASRTTEKMSGISGALQGPRCSAVFALLRARI